MIPANHEALAVRYAHLAHQCNHRATELFQMMEPRGHVWMWLTRGAQRIAAMERQAALYGGYKHDRDRNRAGKHV